MWFLPSLARFCKPCLALQKQKFALMGKAQIANLRQQGGLPDYYDAPEQPCSSGYA